MSVAVTIGGARTYEGEVWDLIFPGMVIRVLLRSAVMGWAPTWT
jgi:hypothetical protein